MSINSLPELQLTTQSVCYMAAQQLCTICGDTPDSLKTISANFDISTDEKSPEYRELLNELDIYFKGKN